MSSFVARPIVMGVFPASPLCLSGPDACGRLNHFMAALSRIAEFERDQSARGPFRRRILTVQT
jgi:hypothetical protein